MVTHGVLWVSLGNQPTLSGAQQVMTFSVLGINPRIKETTRDGFSRGDSISHSLPIEPARRRKRAHQKVSFSLENPPQKGGSSLARSSSREVGIRVPTFFCSLFY